MSKTIPLIGLDHIPACHASCQECGGEADYRLSLDKLLCFFCERCLLSRLWLMASE